MIDFMAKALSKLSLAGDNDLLAVFIQCLYCYLLWTNNLSPLIWKA